LPFSCFVLDSFDKENVGVLWMKGVLATITELVGIRVSPVQQQLSIFSG
jgi:hypothetical protein